MLHPPFLLAAALASSAMTLPAQSPRPTFDPDDQDIVVHGTPAYIIVRGRPRCRPLRDDPYNDVAAPLHHGQSVIAPNRRTGTLELRRDDDPISGPDRWHRAGTALGAFVFRAPGNGSTMCIGAIDDPRGFGQLRQELDAHPYHGRILRFTAWVMTSEAREVRFWLAAGEHRVLLGEDASAMPLRGTRRWTPVSLTIGPVPRFATKISYGFLLEGGGDVWVGRPSWRSSERRPFPHDRRLADGGRPVRGEPEKRSG